MRKTLPREGSEQQRETLVCQGGIRSVGSRAWSPTFPHPAKAVRAPGIFWAMRARFPVARRTSAHHVCPRPQAGMFGRKPPEGEGAVSQDPASATSQPAHPCWRQDAVAQPNFSLRPGKKVWCARWRARPPPPIPHRAWHSAFPHCAPGKGITQLYHPSATQPFPLLL